MAAVVELIDCAPDLEHLAQKQELCAALMYQIECYPLPPDRDVEIELAAQGMLLRPSIPTPEDAELDREFDFEEEA